LVFVLSYLLRAKEKFPKFNLLEWGLERVSIQTGQGIIETIAVSIGELKEKCSP
jgi:hypothetical protein